MLHRHQCLPFGQILVRGETIVKKTKEFNAHEEKTPIAEESAITAIELQNNMKSIDGLPLTNARTSYRYFYFIRPQCVLCQEKCK